MAMETYIQVCMYTQIIEYNDDNWVYNLIGMFEKGLFHGQGVLKKENGDAYDGCWVRGRGSGRMHIKYNNGDEYVGDMLNGNYHGVGKMTFHKKLGSYDGDYANNMPHGQGTRIFSNGNKYVGTFYIILVYIHNINCILKYVCMF